MCIISRMCFFYAIDEAEGCATDAHHRAAQVSVTAAGAP